MSPSTRLSIPFIVILSSLFTVAHFTENGVYSWLAIPFVIITALCHIFAPQINWKYYLKNPPVMPGGLRLLLETKIKFYQNMHPFIRKKFRDRVMLFSEAMDWKVQVSDEFPSDMKICIAASAVRLLMRRDKYLFDRFENIILYPHPFPSPQFPKDWHTSEFFEEDGVVMFAAQPLLRGFLNPEKYYPIALHEYANIFHLNHPNIDFPKFEHSDWQKIQQISGYSEDIVSKSIGLPNINLLSVAIVHLFTFPKRMKRYWPDVYDKLILLFPENEATA